jgi:hypothetical protein
MVCLPSTTEITRIALYGLLNEVVEEAVEIVLPVSCNGDWHTPFDELAAMLFLPQSFFHCCLPLLLWECQILLLIPDLIEALYDFLGFWLADTCTDPPEHLGFPCVDRFNPNDNG